MNGEGGKGMVVLDFGLLNFYLLWWRGEPANCLLTLERLLDRDRPKMGLLSSSAHPSQHRCTLPTCWSALEVSLRQAAPRSDHHYTAVMPMGTLLLRPLPWLPAPAESSLNFFQACRQGA